MIRRICSFSCLSMKMDGFSTESCRSFMIFMPVDHRAVAPCVWHVFSVLLRVCGGGGAIHVPIGPVVGCRSAPHAPLFDSLWIFRRLSI